MDQNSHAGNDLIIRLLAILVAVRALYTLTWLLVVLGIRADLLAPPLDLLPYAQSAPVWLIAGWATYAVGYAVTAGLIASNRLMAATCLYVVSFALDSAIWFYFTSIAMPLVHAINWVVLADVVTNGLDLGVIACLAIIEANRLLKARLDV
ncbi:hypothetical protein [Maricaulis maris]|uniref:Uncharacterized protein n=1 Tax=Maricaulis maris TaxID=74318 RepID=A0A495DKK9_9PROT|nr:hypothetical protein [Maricaulis maris]RKR03154.1 hypothetical protein C7435_1103 [Maricaulis maris]